MPKSKWTEDAILHKVLVYLIETFGMDIRQVDHTNSNNIAEYSSLVIKFLITKGHFINVVIEESAIEHIIDRGRLSVIYNDIDLKFPPTALTVHNWISAKYYEYFKEATTRKNSFTDGYKQYPNDEKGTGSKEQWRESFKKNMNSEGEPGNSNKSKEPKFDFTEEFFKKFFSGTRGHFHFSGKDFEDFMNDPLGGERKEQEDQRQSRRQRGEGSRRGYQSFDDWKRQFDKEMGFDKHTSTANGPRAILGVAISGVIAEDVLKTAWRGKCREWHPDLNAHRLKEAEEMMKQINDAYATLKKAFGYR